MKILYVLNSSKFGGMEVHVADLVRGMKKKDHEIFVWCPEGEMMEIYKSDGAMGIEQKIKFDIDPVYIFKLTKFLKNNSIDIIHAHELKAVTNALLAGFFAGVKVRVSHTHTPISEWRINKIIRFFTTLGYSFLINFFTTTEIALTQSRKNIKMKEGMRGDKLTIIPNGLDTSKLLVSSIQRYEYEKEIKSRYNIPEGAFVFGNLGRITVEKGHEILVRAFAKFLESHLFRRENFYLMLVGGGALEDKIKNLTKELGIEENVVITGRFEDSEKIKYLSTFDVFVFPTFAEGFGIVLIEALSMGIPTICSDLEVLKEVGGGFVDFFKVGDFNDLSDNMEDEYNKTGGENKFIIEGAKEFVEKNYSMEKFIESYENLYKKLLGETK
ncbi:glycosyltransferase family 4 protein [Patescibacteria group bacterium]|nr:glycosyltransferase family 4 protein [Patescibacteria group bacterium]